MHLVNFLLNLLLLVAPSPSLLSLSLPCVLTRLCMATAPLTRYSGSLGRAFNVATSGRTSVGCSGTQPPPLGGIIARRPLTSARRGGKELINKRQGVRRQTNAKPAATALKVFSAHGCSFPTASKFSECDITVKNRRCRAVFN